ncbi:MAG: hypothetical protein ACPLN0_06195 [Candidatus Hydrothermia bacterium]
MRKIVTLGLILFLTVFYGCKKEDETGDEEDNLPKLEATITGPSQGSIGIEYQFQISSNLAYIYPYIIDWGDGSEYTTYYVGYNIPLKHKWTKTGTFAIRAKSLNYSWSDPFYINITNNPVFYKVFPQELTWGSVNNVKELPDGSFLVIGCYSDYDTIKYFLSKTDNTGNIQWTKFYYFSEYCITRFTGENEIMFMTKDLTSFLKIDFNGDSLISVNIPDANYDIFDFTPSRDGNILVCGRTYYYGHYIGIIAKISLQGNTIWVKGIGFEPIFRLLEEDNGEIIAASGTTLFKFNESGDTLWARTINDISGSTPSPIFKLSNRYFLGVRVPSRKILLIKTDFDGNLVSSDSVKNAELEELISAIQTSDNNFIFYGWTSRYGIFGTVIKTDVQGNLIWKQIYDSNSELQSISSLIETADYGLAITGSKGYNVTRPVFAKTDVNGFLP